MKKLSFAVSAVALAAALLPALASAQNIAIVNGKAVPKARFESFMTQVTKQGNQPRTPELENQVKDELVLREIFVQEAEARGLQRSEEYRSQMDVARQSLLIRELFNDYQKKNAVSDAELKAEYDKLKGAGGGGNEYRARHILVEKEDEAKALIAQLKAGAKFEDLAKANSKDPGSAPNGGDLDWAAPGNFVPEFSQAMVKLEKGKFTETAVKSQFGYHIIQLDDSRAATFPSLEEVKPQLSQRLQQAKMTKFREDLKAKAKTDYKFSAQ
ncbi:peptidylprolyl isomerase [Sphaerotilus montanus]|jgi:peptidyl-prolyl cis-trans isomerase C|uniref:peptidylprolyl isomerase n=1 Tax=Sphaerotilus montanus TaxID=522889 RepID=A0A7Y9U8V7_9BURK|nr:peptidylprolyl isomerase [Sphaerotilus montanus]MBP8271595.1 peptidylprolyl isomerase [Sphaerotilus sp.]NYG35036.1 peptidyl-prolyl cis-trans isomerase C [Sphaerotilus montanus]NZD58435.1 peptidylprolyl isomerase [Sphaerotilus montanus]